jgi:hypothetical protein
MVIVRDHRISFGYQYGVDDAITGIMQFSQVV